MNKDTDKVELMNHNITINERQNLLISGITKIDSFDNEEFLLETSAGPLGVKGKDLEIIKLDTYQGNVSIKGKVDSIAYTEDSGKEKEGGLFNKLFK